MKKKLNSKSITVIILATLVILLMLANLFLYLDNEANLGNNNIDQPSDYGNLSEEDFKNAFYNNFLLTYILEGDIQTGSGTLKNEEDGEIYYAVTDYLLENIHTLEDINRLIDDNIDTYGAIRTRKIMESNYANKYRSSNNRLYVKKNDKACFRLEEKIDLSHAEYDHKNDIDIIVYEKVPYTFIMGNDGKPKSPVLLFSCVKNFGNIGIGKDDVFEPNEEDLLTPSDFEHDE